MVWSGLPVDVTGFPTVLLILLSSISTVNGDANLSWAYSPPLMQLTHQFENFTCQLGSQFWFASCPHLIKRESRYGSLQYPVCEFLHSRRIPPAHSPPMVLLIVCRSSLQAYYWPLTASPQILQMNHPNSGVHQSLSEWFCTSLRRCRFHFRIALIKLLIEWCKDSVNVGGAELWWVPLSPWLDSWRAFAQRLWWDSIDCNSGREAKCVVRIPLGTQGKCARLLHLACRFAFDEKSAGIRWARTAWSCQRKMPRFGMCHCWPVIRSNR